MKDFKIFSHSVRMTVRIIMPERYALYKSTFYLLTYLRDV